MAEAGAATPNAAAPTMAAAAARFHRFIVGLSSLVETSSEGFGRALRDGPNHPTRHGCDADAGCDLGFGRDVGGVDKGAGHDEGEGIAHANGPGAISSIFSRMSFSSLVAHWTQVHRVRSRLGL